MAGMFEYLSPTLVILVSPIAPPMWYVSKITVVYMEDMLYLNNIKDENEKSACPIDANGQANY